MRQAHDFGAESEALATILDDLRPQDWHRPTQFKSWTPEGIVRHLYAWNLLQDRALDDPIGFRAALSDIVAAVAAGRAWEAERDLVPESGADLLPVWRDQVAAMVRRWAKVDPRARVPWVGPEMSARSAMTARQMETWAHGQAILDLIGVERQEEERLANVVFLGVGAFAWSFHVQGLPPPGDLPRLELRAPNGEAWTYGAPNAPSRIEGTARDFARVVTQLRNVADTGLVVCGEPAITWMATAQCFAGPRETPPAPGTRFRWNRSSDDFG